MTGRNLLKPAGLSSLRKFLRSELASLRQSPVLVIASEPAAGTPNISMVSEACQAVNFILAQEMGLRSVQSSVSSAFPTIHDLEQRHELLRRTGASSVIAVGSGAAMDLSKVLPFEKGIENLVLVPSTSAAMMAAGSSHSLFLDSIEETLVPLPSTNSAEESSSHTTKTTIAPLESNYFAPADSSHVLFAALSLILDACYRKSNNPFLPETLQNATSLFEENQDFAHDKATELLFQAGQLASYGLGNEDRSTPIALASSLIPTIFPHVHALTFFASLLPGICQQLDSSEFDSAALLIEHVKKISPESIPQISVGEKSLEGFSVPDMSLSHIRSNQTVWKSFDVRDSVLIDILESSMKR